MTVQQSRIKRLHFCRRSIREYRGVIGQHRRAVRLVLNAASSAGDPQGAKPEQLPFSASGTPSSQMQPEEKKPNFVSRVIKPLQDFGFGKMAFMEGGVGLFVFAGIGETLRPVHTDHAIAIQCLTRKQISSWLLALLHGMSFMLSWIGILHESAKVV